MYLIRGKPQRWIALVVCICFSMSLFPEAYAAVPSIEMAVKSETPKLFNLDIPTEMASVEEWYEAPPKPHPKMIVHIQDAHSNYEAQSRIRDLIGYLHKTYGFQTILVEGAAENLDPKYLKLFPDKESNLKLVDALAKEGEVTGAEMFLMENENSVQAVGIEKAELYRKNFLALQNVYREDALLKGFFEVYESKLNQVGSRTFSPRMIQALAEWRKFESGHREFLRFATQLAKMSKQFVNIDLDKLYSQIDWPQLTRLLVLQRVEEELGQVTNSKAQGTVKEQALSEKQAIIDLLKVKDAAAGLIAALEKFDEGNVNLNRLSAGDARQTNSPRALIEALVEEGAKAGFNIQNYPAFAKYAGYLILRSEIVPADLFDEIKKLFDRILDALVKEAASSAQQNAGFQAMRDRLLQIYRDEILAKKLLNLELNRDEWLDVIERKDRFQAADMDRRMREILELPLRPDPSEKPEPERAQRMERLSQAFRAAFEFYAAATNREDYFFQKMQEILAKTDKAILVTGGFHAEGMKDRMRESEISYGTLTPRITKEFSNELYRKVMMTGIGAPELSQATLTAAPISVSNLAAMDGPARAAERQKIVRAEAGSLGLPGELASAGVAQQSSEEKRNQARLDKLMGRVTQVYIDVEDKDPIWKEWKQDFLNNPERRITTLHNLFLYLMETRNLMRNTLLEQGGRRYQGFNQVYDGLSLILKDRQFERFRSENRLAPRRIDVQPMVRDVTGFVPQVVPGLESLGNQTAVFAPDSGLRRLVSQASQSLSGFWRTSIIFAIAFLVTAVSVRAEFTAQDKKVVAQEFEKIRAEKVMSNSILSEGYWTAVFSRAGLGFDRDDRVEVGKILDVALRDYQEGKMVTAESIARNALNALGDQSGTTEGSNGVTFSGFFEGAWSDFIVQASQGPISSSAQTDLINAAGEISSEFGDLIKKITNVNRAGFDDEDGVKKLLSDWNAFNQKVLVPNGFYGSLNVVKNSRTGQSFFSSIVYKIDSTESVELSLGSGQTAKVKLIYGRKHDRTNVGGAAGHSQTGSPVIFVDSDQFEAAAKSFRRTTQGRHYPLLDGVAVSPAVDQAVMDWFDGMSTAQIAEHERLSVRAHELAHQVISRGGLKYKTDNAFGISDDVLSRMSDKDAAMEGIAHETGAYLAQIAYSKEPSVLINLLEHYLGGQPTPHHFAAKFIFNKLAGNSEQVSHRNADAVMKLFRKLSEDPQLQEHAKDLLQKTFPGFEMPTGGSQELRRSEARKIDVQARSIFDQLVTVARVGEVEMEIHEEDHPSSWVEDSRAVHVTRLDLNLLEQGKITRDEFAAILAHELAHIQSHDSDLDFLGTVVADDLAKSTGADKSKTYIQGRHQIEIERWVDGAYILKDAGIDPYAIVSLMEKAKAGLFGNETADSDSVIFKGAPTPDEVLLALKAEFGDLADTSTMQVLLAARRSTAVVSPERVEVKSPQQVVVGYVMGEDDGIGLDAAVQNPNVQQGLIGLREDFGITDEALARMRELSRKKADWWAAKNKNNARADKKLPEALKLLGPDTPDQKFEGSSDDETSGRSEAREGSSFVKMISIATRVWLLKHGFLNLTGNQKERSRFIDAVEVSFDSKNRDVVYNLKKLYKALKEKGYILESLISRQGKRTDVFKAYDRINKRYVAVRIPKIDMEQAVLQNILGGQTHVAEENRLLLKHSVPGFISFYDVGTIPGLRIAGSDEVKNYEILELVDSLQGAFLPEGLSIYEKLGVEKTVSRLIEFYENINKLVEYTKQTDSQRVGYSYYDFVDANIFVRKDGHVKAVDLDIRPLGSELIRARNVQFAGFLRRVLNLYIERNPEVSAFFEGLDEGLFDPKIDQMFYWNQIGEQLEVLSSKLRNRPSSDRQKALSEARFQDFVEGVKGFLAEPQGKAAAGAVVAAVGLGIAFVAPSLAAVAVIVVASGIFFALNRGFFAVRYFRDMDQPGETVLPAETIVAPPAKSPLQVEQDAFLMRNRTQLDAWKEKITSEFESFRSRGKVSMKIGGVLYDFHLMLGHLFANVYDTFVNRVRADWNQVVAGKYQFAVSVRMNVIQGRLPGESIVRLELSDTGTGIFPDVLVRLFGDEQFTTKADKPGAMDKIDPFHMGGNGSALQKNIAGLAGQVAERGFPVTITFETRDGAGRASRKQWRWEKGANAAVTSDGVEVIAKNEQGTTIRIEAVVPELFDQELGVVQSAWTAGLVVDSENRGRRRSESRIVDLGNGIKLSDVFDAVIQSAVGKGYLAQNDNEYRVSESKMPDSMKDAVQALAGHAYKLGTKELREFRILGKPEDSERWYTVSQLLELILSDEVVYNSGNEAFEYRSKARKPEKTVSIEEMTFSQLASVLEGFGTSVAFDVENVDAAWKRAQVLLDKGGLSAAEQSSMRLDRIDLVARWSRDLNSANELFGAEKFSGYIRDALQDAKDFLQNSSNAVDRTRVITMRVQLVRAQTQTQAKPIPKKKPTAPRSESRIPALSKEDAQALVRTTFRDVAFEKIRKNLAPALAVTIIAFGFVSLTLTGPAATAGYAALVAFAAGLVMSAPAGISADMNTQFSDVASDVSGHLIRIISAQTWESVKDIYANLLPANRNTQVSFVVIGSESADAVGWVMQVNAAIVKINPDSKGRVELRFVPESKSALRTAQEIIRRNFRDRPVLAFPEDMTEEIADRIAVPMRSIESSIESAAAGDLAVAAQVVQIRAAQNSEILDGTEQTTRPGVLKITRKALSTLLERVAVAYRALAQFMKSA